MGAMTRSAGERRVGIRRPSSQPDRIRRTSEHVEAVSNGEVLDVTELRIELCDGVSRCVAFGNAAIMRKAGAPRSLQDLSFE